ncbi:MAG: protein translocase subunit SecF [Candidatus Neomarinimicrobiota bacterium]
MRIIKETHIKFSSQRKYGFLLSGFILLAGVLSLVLNGGPKLSIDFKGGTLVSVKYTENVDVNDVRDVLSNINIEGQTFDFSSGEIKHFGGLSQISVRLPHFDNEPENFTRKIVNYLYESFPEKAPADQADFLLGSYRVGPKIGAELSGKAFMAILSALGLILLYISFRFEFKFALGAIAALAHDILITLGLFSLLGYEISLPIIAAFLTIVGYSLNDTIVIFDRIRENAKTAKRKPFNEIIDSSINNSLSRTFITSITTFMVVFVLWLVGGQVIHNFAFAMMVGVIVGTYSSIYIASPIVLLLHGEIPSKK